MTNKTKLIVLIISIVLMLGFMTWEFFTGNFFGLSITAVMLFAIYPYLLWDTIVRMRYEREVDHYRKQRR